MAARFTVKIVGINSITPNPPNTTTAFRAAPSDQPRRIKNPDAAPPKKIPEIRGNKGTQNAMNPDFGEFFGPEVNRKPNRHKEPNRIRQRLREIVPHVCGSFSKSPQREGGLAFALPLATFFRQKSFSRSAAVIRG